MTNEYTVTVVVDRVIRRPYTTYIRGIEAESELVAMRKAKDALERLPDPPGDGWEEGEAFEPELAEPAFFLPPSGAEAEVQQERAVRLGSTEATGSTLKQEDGMTMASDPTPILIIEIDAESRPVGVYRMVGQGDLARLDLQWWLVGDSDLGPCYTESVLREVLARDDLTAGCRRELEEWQAEFEADELEADELEADELEADAIGD